MGLVGDTGKQSTASQAELVGSTAATIPHNCWPKPALKSPWGEPIPLSSGNGAKKFVTAMKWLGSPGSTPHRFVALTTNQGPLLSSDCAAKSIAWTSL